MSLPVPHATISPLRAIEKEMLFDGSSILQKKIEKNDNGVEVVKIEGYASTAEEDRHGDIVLLSAWTKEVIDMYLENPVLLFNHRRDQPEGRVTEMSVDDRGLYVKAEVLANSYVGQRVAAGFVKSFSVGFRLKDYFYDPALQVFKITEVELYEISLAVIPANPRAQFSLAKSLEGLLGEDARSTLISKTNQPPKMKKSEVAPDSPVADQPQTPNVDLPEAAHTESKSAEATTPAADEDSVKGSITKLFKSFKDEIRTMLKGASPAPAVEEAPVTKTPEEVIVELKQKVNDLTSELAAAKAEVKSIADIEAKAEQMIQAKVKEVSESLGADLETMKADLAAKSAEYDALKAKYDRTQAIKTVPPGGSDPQVLAIVATGNEKAYKENAEFFQ